MKINALRTIPVELPLGKPVRTGIHNIRSIGAILVFLDTDEGITGESYLFSLGTTYLTVLNEMVRSLGGIVIGYDPHKTSDLWSTMFTELNFFGPKGVAVMGMSAIDCAAWDIVGKAHGLPVCKLLGVCRDRIPAYASGGLWLSDTIDEIVAEANDFVSEGYRAVKLRVGKARVEEDVERVIAVREAVGDDVELMIDANQSLTVNHAIRLGRSLEDYNIFWFEEPVWAYDFAGHAQVAAALDTPIASGETIYTRYDFQELLTRRAADILMPDLQRIGGISECMKVANLAEAFNLPISPHLFTEYALQICAAVSNCHFSEHMPWFEALFHERLEKIGGEFLVPDRPGLGFTFDPDAIERYRIHC